MQMTKHDPETEMDMDMTPMIDVVFLLIIFFMVITDLSQKDLEDLELPQARYATPDKPKPGDLRPVVNILQDGKIVVRGETYYDPEAPDDYAKVKTYLSDMARQMDKAHFDAEAGTGPMIPDEALLIRADQYTPFKYIQKVMAVCGEKGIQIWKVQLAAKEDKPS